MHPLKKNEISEYLRETSLLYKAPSNLTNVWNAGIYALLCLAIQIVTGIVLAMHYIPEIRYASASVEHIMRGVNYGWLLRYAHANGASMFFLAVYAHTFRGLYYGSYTHPRQALWIVGVIILLVMIITAFLGYVLPWGQMSYWGATVITNLLTALPHIGTDVVMWIWGGYAINRATLTRFYSLHYTLPFILSALVGLHLMLLHQRGSNNPLGVRGGDNHRFTPYYVVKDIYGVVFFVMLYAAFVCFAPNALGHSDNYIPASPLVTPPHIVPEWYFLPFYAILRSIPDKVGGVLAMLFSIIRLAVIPFILKPEVRSMRFRPISRYLYWVFVLVCILLAWIGGKPVKNPYLEIGRMLTISYFLYLWVIQPLVIVIENNFWTNTIYLPKIMQSRAMLDLAFKYNLFGTSHNNK